jgi:hypothetical protein
MQKKKLNVVFDRTQPVHRNIRNYNLIDLHHMNIFEIPNLTKFKDSTTRKPIIYTANH